VTDPRVRPQAHVAQPLRAGAAQQIDASGDADLCHHAGFGYELAGAEAPAQTLTTTFKMVNVDLARRRQISTAEVHERMAEAAASGEYDLPRREGSDHITPIEGMIATVMTRIPSFRERDGVLTVTVAKPPEAKSAVKKIAVKAAIHTLNGFSAHAGQSELMGWLDHLAPAKPRVVLTHGEARGRESLAALIEKRHGLKPLLPAQGDVIEL